MSDPRGRTRVPRAYEIGKSRKLSSDFLDLPISFDCLIASRFIADFSDLFGFL